ncbi:hypothetical protein SAMN05892883_0563 [Jatrophihabitans sp. GAS493]|nr:hypothetical protein SAMN05892883_0563 [Jatrophihabitans sp. GAS493]
MAERSAAVGAGSAVSVGADVGVAAEGGSVAGADDGGRASEPAGGTAVGVAGFGPVPTTGLPPELPTARPPGETGWPAIEVAGDIGPPIATERRMLRSTMNPVELAEPVPRRTNVPGSE